MNATAKHTIEHQLPYRQNLVFCLLMPILFGCFTPLCLLWALTDDGEIVVYGNEIAGVAATAIRWSSVLLILSFFVVSLVFLWGRVVRPEQQIRITVEGIIAPRNRWKSEAEFVRFDEIEGVSVTRYRGHPTFFNIHSVHGKFAIARQMMTRQEVEEVIRIVQERARQSAGRGF